ARRRPAAGLRRGVTSPPVGGGREALSTGPTMRMLLCVFAILVTLLTAGPLRTQEAAKQEVKMDEDTKKATAKALEFLAGRQNSDGSWSDGSYIHNTAITAYTMLAFMSQGHLPGQGHYGPERAKAAGFLVAPAPASDGYV